MKTELTFPANPVTDVTIGVLRQSGPAGQPNVSLQVTGKVTPGSSPVAIPKDLPSEDPFTLNISASFGVEIKKNGVVTTCTFCVDARNGFSYTTDISNKGVEFTEAVRKGESTLVQAQRMREVLESLTDGVTPFAQVQGTLPVTGEGVVEITDWFRQRNLLTSTGALDLAALDRLATPQRSTHQIFSTIPQQTPLPVVDVDALPVSNGTVLLPAQIPIDSSLFDVSPRVPPATEFGAPPAFSLPPANELPGVPAMDRSGNPIIIDLEGPTSGVLLVTPDTRGAVLLEVPDFVAGGASTDSQGRPIRIDVRPRVNVAEGEPVPREPRVTDPRQQFFNPRR